MTKPTRDTLRNKIDSFLKERRKSQYGGWAEVTQEDMKALDAIIYELVKLKMETDADGDLAIEWDLINRKTHEKMQYFKMPHVGKEYDPDEILELALDNLSIASDKVSRIMQGRRWERDEKRRKEKVDK